MRLCVVSLSAVARGLRVLFAPIRRAQANGVVCGTLSLTRLGGGSSAAKRNAPAPATITFVASCFTSARAPERNAKVGHRRSAARQSQIAIALQRER